MHDPAIARDFNFQERESTLDTNWWRGEPIWVAAQKQGVRTATCFRPGSSVRIGGIHPTYWLEYDSSMPNQARIAQILDWLSRPEAERPRLLTLYFSAVDSAGHEYGPDSVEVNSAIREIDTVIGKLLVDLRTRGEDINVMIVSDHGMSGLSSDRIVVLDEYFDVGKDAVLIQAGELVFLEPKGLNEKDLLRKLRKVPHARFYSRTNLPRRLKCRGSERIPAIVGLPQDGWLLLPRELKPQFPEVNGKGTHGYDNRYMSMRGIFIAVGPAFANGIEVKPFSIVHLYEIMCRVLNINAAPNDGNLREVAKVLKNGVQGK